MKIEAPWLILLGLLAFAPICQIEAGQEELGSPSCPSVGAIRWDAWHGKEGLPGRAVERTLGPARWHYRLPFCGRVISDSVVEIECDTQAAMDQEIDYAARAGIDYWAFVAYPPDDAMSKGLQLYLASSRRDAIRFSLIVEASRLGQKSNFRNELRRYVQLMKEPTYKKLVNGRPLFFLGFISKKVIERNWGSLSRLRYAIDEFRQMAIVEGVGNPYIVVMDFNPKRASQLLADLGLDAISTYATHKYGEDAPFSDLVLHVRRFWESSRATGSPVVPIVMTGWDRRPRVENPVPWEGNDTRDKTFYKQPKPEELTMHLIDAIQWVRNHPESNPANTILIYAWNENDEGGWLIPTLSEGTARIDAVSHALRNQCHN